MNSGNHEKLIKKIVIAALCVSVFVGTSLLLLTYIYFPRWVKSWVDFRPRPPYLPISVPFTADQAPCTTTAYFVASEDDERLTLYLHYNYDRVNYDDLRKELDKNKPRKEKNPETGRWEPLPMAENDIHQQLEIELWTVRSGREESVFTGIVTNPIIDGSTREFIDSIVLTFPFSPQENEMYRIEVGNALATPALTALSEPEIYICQGCLPGK
ncbi:MAG: hypothetical protein LBP33_03820 [Candidatus Adiutrix sp.]|jgi:hypothetical protein|nr:hypothetical protein [Candidatus Adiutrix sp.]